MSNLFIIGNGFDLAHKLPTSYEDFHKYLIKQYPNALNIEPSFNIESTLMPDGEEEFNKDEVVAFLMEVISAAEEDGNNWSDIETSLGRLNFDDYFDDIYSLFGGEDDDSSLFRMAYRVEDVSSNFYSVIIKIKELFSEWIDTIDISSTSPINTFSKLLDPYEDSFLTFNYTTVLEDIYEAINVEHFHGVQHGEIVIGHAEERKEFESFYIGADWSLSQIHYALKKDTEKIINDFDFFFDNLAFIKGIYTFGFSFSQVDLPYIQKICQSIDTSNVTWYLHTFHNDEERKRFKGIVQECGFEGQFDTFS